MADPKQTTVEFLEIDIAKSLDAPCFSSVCALTCERYKNEFRKTPFSMGDVRIFAEAMSPFIRLALKQTWTNGEVATGRDKKPLSPFTDLRMRGSVLVDTNGVAGYLRNCDNVLGKQGLEVDEALLHLTASTWPDPEAKGKGQPIVRMRGEADYFANTTHVYTLDLNALTPAPSPKSPENGTSPWYTVRSRYFEKLSMKTGSSQRVEGDDRRATVIIQHLEIPNGHTFWIAEHPKGSFEYLSSTPEQKLAFEGDCFLVENCTPNVLCIQGDHSKLRLLMTLVRCYAEAAQTYFNTKYEKGAAAANALLEVPEPRFKGKAKAS